MKKLAFLFVSMYIGTALFYGQTGQTAEGLLKAKAKSDLEIQDAKKNIKSSTWEKRGDLFLDMAQFNTKGLYQGMPKAGITGAEIIVGKPKDIKAIGNGEDWIYERVTLHFVGDALENWEETMPLDPDALDKAFEAYNKADSLDVKGKFKSKNTVKVNSYTLRGLYTSKAVELSGKQQFAKSVEYFDKALILAEWPKSDSDTTFKVGLVTYYAGFMAYNGKDYKTAEKYYTKCIEKGWEGGTPYNGLAAVYKETKESTKEYEILQKGFDKFPGSKDLMYGFINYYLGSGQSDKALEKLEQAIKDDPSNPSLFFAKATLFDNMSQDTTGKYNAEQKKDFLGKGIEGYKKAIDVKADYFDANYNLGALYYNAGVYKLKEADLLTVKEKEKFEIKVNEAKEEMNKALPFLEKAHEIDGTHRLTVQTLITIYHRLQKYDKKKEMQEKLENLPAEKSGL
jgi:tetratricopeptide (TPR) repeat protein